MIHSLVAESFLGKRPEGFHVNHINGIKTDNRADNLQYMTPANNNRHANRTGLNPIKGSDNPAAKINENQANNIRRMFINGKSVKEIRLLFNLSKTQVCDILKGKSWSHLDPVLIKKAKEKDRRNTKLSDADVVQIKKIIGTKPKQHIADEFGVSSQAIRAIELGKIYAHI